VAAHQSAFLRPQTSCWPEIGRPYLRSLEARYTPVSTCLSLTWAQDRVHDRVRSIGDRARLLARWAVCALRACRRVWRGMHAVTGSAGVTVSMFPKLAPVSEHGMHHA